MLIIYVVFSAITTVFGDLLARPTFHPPIAGDSVSPVCANFTYGNWPQREFYSPGYPGNYPNKTDCIHLIIAPRGYRIQLDFRDEFKIEPSTDCKYDYVEFRDGPFGYSPLIGRFCGPKHPPMMESSSRFMWVHFASDDSIEYKGFRIVYDFYKPGDGGGNSSLDTSVCHIEVDISKHEGYLSQDDIPTELRNRVNGTSKPLDCTWAFYLPADHRVTLKFEHLMTTLGSCDDSFLEIYEDTTAMADRRKKLCGSLPTFYKSDSNHAYIRLYAKKALLMPKFSAFFTVFIPGPCSPNLFECGDNTCIYKSLECNGNDNCNYRWDEQFCETSTAVVPTREPVVIQYHTVIIGIVGGAIITIILLAIVITCVQKTREEKRQHNVLHQEESQAMEIEMTNLLNRSPVHTRHSTLPGQRGDPNGPVNHISAARPLGNQGNHVPHAQPHLAAHTQAISITPDVDGEKPEAQGKSAERFPEQNGAGATYRRYLDVHGKVYYNGDDSSPNPSPRSPIPTVVTIEKRPTPGQKLTLTERRDRSPSPANRDQTPSPRPDVIQEEKFVYPDTSARDRYYKAGPRSNPDLRIRDDGKHTDTADPRFAASRTRRRLSDETIRSDVSDVWKPMTSAEVKLMPLYRKPPGRQQGNSGMPPFRRGGPEDYVDVPGQYGGVPFDYRGRAHQLGRGDDEPEVELEPSISYYPAATERVTTFSEYAPETVDTQTGAVQRRKPAAGFEPTHTEFGYPGAVKPQPGEPAGSRVPPAPPQRRTPALTHQSSAPMPPTGDIVTYDASPPAAHRAAYSRTPPPSHRLAANRTPPPRPRTAPYKQTPSVPKGRAQEKPPSIFYTRPNPARSERAAQPRQHRPV